MAGSRDRRRQAIRPDITPRASAHTMETPLIRPGATLAPDSPLRLVVHFDDAAGGNLAVQMLATFGVPGDRIGVIDPDRMERRRGMILTASCPDETTLARAEAFCRKLGGRVHRDEG